MADSCGGAESVAITDALKGGCMTKEQAAVLTAARKWWEALRPMSWNEAEHIAQPMVNAHGTDEDAMLANAVGAVIELERSKPTQGAIE